ncbi:MAG TPA: heterodisulfide reductase-related iron-sulfur binding cluster [Gammaproteobacteria bacterium]|nr:heterodisulfide reductase-related iron-sulfur binding cluster [Gammaproteobacteria bacterium]
MQTRFTKDQLADPEVAEAEKILRRCVHCGFCTATCPTYVLLGDELDGPRGRIYLIKEMLENGRPATAEVVRHLDRCLSCLACVTTCPSGVDYQHLIDHARVHVERTYRRPWPDRALRAVLAAVLPHPERFRAALGLAALLRPAAKLAPRRLRHMADIAIRARGTTAGRGAAADTSTHTSTDTSTDPAPPSSTEAAREPRARVALLAGCVQSVLAPQIDAAAARLLRLAGADVVHVPGCCGAIVHHLGRAADNRALGGALIERIAAEIDGRGIDAIAATASGCGTHVKDFGRLFALDERLGRKAEAIAARARDVTEVLAELGLPKAVAPRALAVAYHSACSLQHGQRVERPPRALLEHAGYTVVEIPEGHLCCGSAGTYNLLQPDISERLKARKIENIGRTGADVVAAGNIGCMTQLGGGDVPVVHTVELLDWAMGGARPAALPPSFERPLVKAEGRREP